MMWDVLHNAVFVSCDIVSHGDDDEHERQVSRIRQLNACISALCNGRFGVDVIWASGGDGGHLALFGADKCRLALQLIVSLRRWAETSDAGPGNLPLRLRLAAHAGQVSVVEGADGRKELVGDGINTCGGILKFAPAGHAIVTRPFRDLCEAEDSDQSDELARSARFGREQQVYLKHDRAMLIAPLLLPGTEDSQASMTMLPEKQRVDNAMKRRRYWAAIYHAKRLLQVDSADQEAVRALQTLTPTDLVVHAKDGVAAHPLLSALNRQALHELVRASELVEREDGETICSQNDTGDAMFIVLKGGIGVAMRAADENGAPAPFSIRFGEGDIVGELALALNRRRTATLQAIGSTAFLSINYATLTNLIETASVSDRLERVFKDFLLERSLRFVCQNAPYLAKGPLAPLARQTDPWEILAGNAQQYKLGWDQAAEQLSSKGRFSEPGVYILAGGALVESTRNEFVPKRLDADNLPLVCVNLPGVLVSAMHPFQIDLAAGGPVVNLVRISDRSLRAFGPNVFSSLVDQLKRQLASQFALDVFISYSHRDEAVASAWRSALEDAGLRVYMGRPDPMRKFKKEIELALAEALVMIPLVSERATGPSGEAGWVQREIAYRRTLFDEDHSNILPVELTPGLAAIFADGFSAVPAPEGGLERVAEVIEAISEVREGKRAPPYATGLPADLQL
jgi:CRP-like cAMP-binding protein